MRLSTFSSVLLLTALGSLAACDALANDSMMRPLRVATFNTSLNSNLAGGLIEQLAGDHLPARKVAAIIQRVRPDVILLNEFDFDDQGRAAALFIDTYLAKGQLGERPIRYAHRFMAAVNTGVASGLDLTGNGKSNDPGDAWGFGAHAGQYGMLVLSRYRIDESAVRTFQNLRWSAMPDALAPIDPESSKPWYAPEVWAQLRLSSKSHWDVPIQTPLGTLHFLVAHPTPPVFDGPEDRNGRRNHDEIRLWAEYLSGTEQAWLCDDAGRCGGLAAEQDFVIAGDYNADPLNGDSAAGAIEQLLDHPRLLTYSAPTSVGAAQAPGKVDEHGNPRGSAAEATGDFGARVGTMRIDYVLPSKGFAVKRSGVFWPPADRPEAEWLDASDHRLVWLDLQRATDNR